MAGDKELSLTVKLGAVDMLSGALKNIMGFGDKATFTLRKLRGETKDYERQLKSVRSEMASASGNVTKLIERERALAAALAKTNAEYGLQSKALARTKNFAAMGSRMRESGMHNMMVGGAILYPAYEMAKAAGDVEALSNKLRVLGLEDKGVQNLRKFAENMDVAGSSIKDNMRYLVEAQGAFRETGSMSLSEQVSGAKLMAPILAKIHVASKALKNDFSEEQERGLLRFIEQNGGTNDPKRAAQIADGVFRAVQSSGGNLNFADYQSFFSKASTSAFKLSSRSLFSDFEPLIAELHERAGAGLRIGYNRMNGITGMQNAGSAEMLRLGLWDKNKVILNSQGGVKRFVQGQNALGDANSALLSASPVDFYNQVILPAYKRAGVKDIERENAMLFGPAQGGQLFNQIQRMMPTLLRSRSSFDKTQGIDQAYETVNQGFFGQQGKMTAAWENFMVVAGSKGGLLDALTNGLIAATSALKYLTAMANAHPTAFKFIGQAVVYLGMFRFALGAVRVVLSYLFSPIGKLLELFMRFRTVGFIATLMSNPWIKALLFIGKGARWVGSGLLGLGRLFMVLGPIALRAGLMLARGALVALGPWGWLALGVATAAYLIYSNWSSITKMFSIGWKWIKDTWAKLPANFKTVGLNIIAGLVSGLLGGLPGLLMWAGHMALQFADKFKAMLGIKSPSRVFMAFGHHITHGLALGLDQGTHRPVGAMRRMTHAVGAAALVTVGAGAATAHAPRTMNVTIHIHQNAGESADALAQRVAKQLHRMNANDSRAAYADDA